MTTRHFDVAIIGGGIAGASAAAHLADAATVVVLEQERELAHHTTSRSAAIYLEHDGGTVFCSLASASRAFFEQEHPELSAPLLEPLAVLNVGGEEQRAQFVSEAQATAMADRPTRIVEGTELLELCPVLRPDTITVGLLEATAASLDVMGLHQLYVRKARDHGAEVWPESRVTGIARRGGHWHLETAVGAVTAGVVVNAAGAWGDQVAQMAGIAPVGLTPMRRTAFTSPINVDPTGWPFVYAASSEFPCYFKPEAGNQLLCSLSDETPEDPRDTSPEEIDVARAIEHINTITTLNLRSVRTSWAGQRTFAPDRCPVFGGDPDDSTFIWMVGQGGWGIVTSPAAGMAVRSAVLGTAWPQELLTVGVSAATLAPRR